MKSFLVVLLMAGASELAAQTFAIVNARIFPVSSAAIERGTILVKDGLIEAVGERLAVPKGTKVVDGKGLSVYPGWVNAHTQLGLTEVSGIPGSVDSKEIGRFNPAAKAWVAVNPHSEMIKTARTNGVTTALIAPEGNQVAGTASVLNLLGDYPDRMTLRASGAIVINVPSMYRMEGAFGSTPPTLEARRKKATEYLAKLKQYLREAKSYSEMRARSGAAGQTGNVDNALEAMVPLMRGKVPAIIAASHFREIRDAVALAKEFGLKLIVAGGQDAWKVAPLLKENDVAVLYDALHSLPRSSEDPYDSSFHAPEQLRRAGVRFAIVTGSNGDARNLPYHAATAAAHGLEREDALRSITIWAADILGVGDEVGSLEKGKLANLLVTKGDPLDIRTEIVYVFIEGREVPLGSRNSELFEKFRGVPPKP